MPEIPFELVKIDAAAGGEFGIFEGKIKGRVAADLELTASACHGLQLGLSGKIAGLVEGRAQALFVGAQLRGEASAEAGAHVIIRLEPNLFEQLGLSIDAGAYARASAAGSIAVYLTPEYFARFVNDNFDDFSADIFLIFLEEVYAEIGVWGKVAFSAMAEGHINLVLDMQNLDAGFEISAGYNAGLKAGTGWDFYAKAGFRDLRRAVLRSSLRISTEVEKAIIEARLPQANYLAFGFNFTFPLITVMALDLGRASYDKKALLSKEEIGSIVLDNFVENLQRFAIDRLVDSAIGRLTNAFTDLYYRISGITLTQEDEAQVETEIQALITLFKKGRIELHDIPTIITRVINLIDLLDGGYFTQLKQPLTLFWLSGMLSIQAKSLLDEFYADIGIGNSVIGGIGAGGAIDILPNAPEFVKEEVRRELGPDVVEVGVSEAIDYIIAVGVSDLLDDYVPDFAHFRDLVSSRFDITEGELVEDLLRLLKQEGSLQNLRSYTAFKGFVKLELIQHVLLQQLLPQLQSEVDNEIFAEYLNEVVSPSLVVVSDFLFEKLDTILIDDVLAVSSFEYRAGLMESLSSGCGTVVFNVLARNILFFDQMVSEFLLENVHRQFGILRGYLNDGNHPFFQSCKMLAHQGLPGKPEVSGHIEAFRILLFDCISALEQLSGPGVYTLDRRKRMTRLKREILLSIGGGSQFQPGDPLEAVIAEMISCNIPAEQVIKITELAEVLFAIGVDSLEIIAQRLLPGVADFYLKITLLEFTGLRQKLLNAIDDYRETFLTALEAYNEASDAFKEDIVDALDTLKTALDDLSETIANHIDSDWEINFKVRLKVIGETSIKNQNLDPSAEQAALIAFHTVDWLVIEPAVDAMVPTVKTALVDFIGTLDGFVDAGSDAATAFIDFIGSLEDIALSSLAGLVIGAADAATALVETLFPTYIQQQIASYLEQRREFKELQQQKAEREAELEQLRIDKDRARDRYDNINHKTELDIEIVNPANDFHFIYPASTEITLIFHGFSEEMIVGEGRRVQVMLNATPLVLKDSDIVYNAKIDAYLFTTIFPRGRLMDGINILEASWIYGESSEETRRTAVTFVVDEDSYFPRHFFDMHFSFNPPGRDADHEYFKLTWQGEDELNMSQWLLCDKAGHRYILPELVLEKGQSVTISTGGDPNLNQTAPGISEKMLYMGRKKAIWNNEGDTAFLIKDNSVLVVNTSYIGFEL